MAVWSFMKSGFVASSERWDAEFFSPDNLKLSRKLAKHHPVRIDSFADVTDGIHASPEWVDKGVAYLSAKCVREHVIDVLAAGQISAAQDASNPRTRARVGDVVITSVGTIGNAAVVEKWMLPANMDRHLAIIRIRDTRQVDPYFLATFLNCKFGRFQSIRESTGNVQLNLFIEKIKGMRVPLGKELQRVGSAVKAACSDLHASSALYPEAEQELLDSIGWKALSQRDVELSYVRPFAELSESGRFDSEFFQPHYTRIAKALVKHGSRTIGEFCPRPTRGVQPEIFEDGEVVVIDSKSVRPFGVEPATGDRTNKDFAASPTNAKARVMRGDVLLNSTGRGTIGRAACYQSSAPALCDNHVAILRPDPAVCNPVYLALFLNSPAGLAQSEQFQTGSSGQLEIYPEHIQQFRIHLRHTKTGAVDLAWQERLASRVESAVTAKVAARTKLDGAKRRLEELLG